MLFLLINSTLYPLAAFWGRADRETAILYGWKKINVIIYDIGIEQKLNKVVFTDYRLATLYSFHSDNYNTDAIMEKRVVELTRTMLYQTYLLSNRIKYLVIFEDTIYT